MKTTPEKVEIFEKAVHVFIALHNEVKTHAQKKPDAILSATKVDMINKLLSDLLVMLHDEPDVVYLSKLDDADLPTASDACLMLAQFQACVTTFERRYYVHADFDEELDPVGGRWSV
jgi:hypothetical protein